MALIECMECGKQISDMSSRCPNCGCPTSESIKKAEIEAFKRDNRDKMIKKCPMCSTEFEEPVFDCPVCGLSVINTPFMMEEARREREANIPKCPTCGSTKIKKVSATSKAVSVGLFGLFSQKVKKTWHCNSCGYEW